MSVLGSHLYQCTSWHCCERLHWLQWIFCEDSSTCLSISWWVIYECTCPHRAECSGVFHQKQHEPMSHLPYSPDLTPGDCCMFIYLFVFVLFPSMKKVLKRKSFANVEEVKEKSRKSTKTHQNQLVQKLFWAVEKNLNRCTTSNGKYFEGDWCLKHVRINTQFFINKFWVFYIPHHTVDIYKEVKGVRKHIWKM